MKNNAILFFVGLFIGSGLTYYITKNYYENKNIEKEDNNLEEINNNGKLTNKEEINQAEIERRLNKQGKFEGITSFKDYDKVVEYNKIVGKEEYQMGDYSNIPDEDCIIKDPNHYESYDDSKPHIITEEEYDDTLYEKHDLILTRDGKLLEYIDDQEDTSDIIDIYDDYIPDISSEFSAGYVEVYFCDPDNFVAYKIVESEKDMDSLLRG